MRLPITSCLLITLQAGAALAQSAPAPAAKDPAAPAQPAKPAASTTATPEKKTDPAADAAPMQQVEVVAERPTNRIDRQVYDVKSDISTSNASAADALSNVPSVQVDPDGAVRLRGNQNVTILLDGKPSAMLSGENRGAALNAMPADFIESIEVINNPGAEFGNEGGGGPILNFISRRNRKPGGFGGINGNYGTAGRYNGGINGSYSEGYASVDAFLNFRHDGRGSNSFTERERIDPISRAISPSTQEGRSKGLNDNVNFATNFRYNVGTADRMGGSLGYNHGGRDSNGLTHYLDYASDGHLLGDSLRSTSNSGTSTSHSGSVFYEHKMEDDATIKADLRVSSSKSPSNVHARRTFTLSTYPRPDDISSQYRDPSTRLSDFTVDYLGKLGEDGYLVAGIKVIDTTQDFDTRYTNTDPVTGNETINGIYTNAFNVDERVSAAYASYEYRLNERWSVKGGLRTEHTKIDLEQLTSHISVSNSYNNTMPSAFVSYKLDKDTTLRLAYSHRLHRPNSNDLNPYIVYQSPTDRSVGNPKLKPSQSNSYELSYDSTVAGVKTDVRLFSRVEDDVVTQRQSLAKDENGQDIVVTTRENFGTSKSRGVELVFSGKPLPGLTVNLNGNWRHSEQTQFASLFGGPATLSGNAVSCRARLNYQLNEADQIQLAINGQGKQLYGQGYRDPNWTANLTWSHRFSPTLTMLINSTDIFNTNRMESHTTSDFLRQTTTTRYDGRIIYIGFRYTLGGVTGDQRFRRGDGTPGMRGPGGGMGPGGMGPGGGGGGGPGI
ncbi:outer membrane beta-barrel family protein [Massilia sp. TS11]|uniref:outer membrane beta-barrel family protein n=1 Tax=Massilia sp. TS11 TaxID=2908003 RepID=UPI001EDC6ACF|nr:outer membrane beta-barrel family protein [Massilia sp. TS11]MCG2583950.1 TonB-dependent receptor [Massilia sp. TS11]